MPLEPHNTDYPPFFPQMQLPQLLKPIHLPVFLRSFGFLFQVFCKFPPHFHPLVKYLSAIPEMFDRPGYRTGPSLCQDSEWSPLPLPNSMKEAQYFERRPRIYLKQDFRMKC